MLTRDAYGSSMPASGGKVACFATEYLLPGLHPVCWHPDNRAIYCCGSRGVAVQVLRVDTVTGEVRPLTEDVGVYDRLRMSADGMWLVCTYRTPTTLRRFISSPPTGASGGS